MIDILSASKFTDRDLIEALLGSFYIIDYGYIIKVNSDKTVKVGHAKFMRDWDDKDFPQTVTDNIEVLTISGAGFSINWDYDAGDKVLLLGMKDYIPAVDDVTKTTSKTALMSYTRQTIKAFPLCVFNSDAKVKLESEDGKLTVTASDKIELNGNSKSFVTYDELNNALTQFASQLSASLLGATYVNTAGAPTPLTWSAGSPPSSIDISGSKTTKVVTG